MNAPVKILSWETHEFEKKDRHPDWIWYAGLVGLLAALVSFFFGDIFFGIFLILASVLVVIYAKKEPNRVVLTVYDIGIGINNDLIEYKHIKQFWLDETGKGDKLLLLVEKSFVPLLVFSLEGVTKEQVLDALKGKIPEVQMRESFGVKIFDHLGF